MPLKKKPEKATRNVRPHPISLRMTVDAVKQLKALAEEMNDSQVGIIEELIKDAYKLHCGRGAKKSGGRSER